jgi:hypothetical protein
MARFATEETALKYLEAIRWPNGVTCVHSGNADASRIGQVVPDAEKGVRGPASISAWNAASSSSGHRRHDL